MKKFTAAALAIAMGFGLVFAEDANPESKGRIASLSSAAGTISFGAWGRSTFMIGQKSVGTKIDVTPNISDNAAAAAALNANPAAFGPAYAAGGFEGVADALRTYGMMETVRGQAADTVTSQLAGQGVSSSDTSDSDGFVQVAPNWSYGSRVGFWIVGRTNDEKWGFDFNLDSDARALFVQALNKVSGDDSQVSKNEDGKYAVAIGDQAKIWGMFDAGVGDIKVAFGKMRESELRGVVGDFGQRETMKSNGDSDCKSEDDIFHEFWPNMGIFTSFKGKEDSALKGLYVAACADLAGLVNGNDEYRTSFGNAASQLQGAIGYTIADLVTVKSQFIADSIEANNYRYKTSKYKAARDAGFNYSSFAGLWEFGIDWLGFAGGAKNLSQVDLQKTPNANIIQLGVKVPMMIDEDLRQYDPEKFYNYYACLGTMGVIQQGFILYKAHIWGGQGVSNLTQYTDIGTGSGLLDYTGNAADILMAGFDALAEVCLNPFGAQNHFLGLSFNYSITNATADGNCKVNGQANVVNDLKMQSHTFGIEAYFKRTFAANNYFFVGAADRVQIDTMDGSLDLSSNFGNQKASADLSYKKVTNMFYIPVGVEMFF